MKQTFCEFSTGPRRRTKRLLAEWAPLPAVLPEPGRLLLGSPALPHSGLRLPASVLPSPVPPVFPAILPEPGHVFPPVRPLHLHQLHPSASASGMALAEVALRRGGAPVTVTPGSQPRPTAGVSSCPSAAPRSRGRGCSSRGRSSRDAPWTSRPGRSSGDFNFTFPSFSMLRCCCAHCQIVRKSHSAQDQGGQHKSLS